MKPSLTVILIIQQTSKSADAKGQNFDMKLMYNFSDFQTPHAI